VSKVIPLKREKNKVGKQNGEREERGYWGRREGREKKTTTGREIDIKIL